MSKDKNFRLMKILTQVDLPRERMLRRKFVEKHIGEQIIIGCDKKYFPGKLQKIDNYYLCIDDGNKKYFVRIDELKSFFIPPEKCFD